jgi:hypothetical protein
VGLSRENPRAIIVILIYTCGRYARIHERASQYIFVSASRDDVHPIERGNLLAGFRPHCRILTLFKAACKKAISPARSFIFVVRFNYYIAESATSSPGHEPSYRNYFCSFFLASPTILPAQFVQTNFLVTTPKIRTQMYSHTKLNNQSTSLSMYGIYLPAHHQPSRTLTTQAQKPKIPTPRSSNRLFPLLKTMRFLFLPVESIKQTLEVARQIVLELHAR